MKILYLVTDDSFFWSHRRSLAAAARDAGWEVVVATPPGPLRERIEGDGFRFCPVRMTRSKNPLAILAGLVDLVRLYRRERPDLAHHVSMRPILLGSIAARLAGVEATVALVTGLGYVFSAGSRPLRWAVEQAYRLCLRGRSCRVVFQNPDDRDHFVAGGIVEPDRATVILGSGVDTRRFRPLPEPAGTPCVLLASRMLRTKGVEDLVEAGRILRGRGVPHRIVLAGDPDEQNPSSIPRPEIEGWGREGVVEWVGRRDDVEDLLEGCHVACLPSYYREGVPRFLLEAMAAGRPVVTTDTPGCREVVRGGANGLLVPKRNPRALADALEALLSDPERRRAMGARGRRIVAEEFADEVVIEQVFDVYRMGTQCPLPTGA